MNRNKIWKIFICESHYVHKLKQILLLRFEFLQDFINCFLPFLIHSEINFRITKCNTFLLPSFGKYLYQIYIYIYTSVKYFWFLYIDFLFIHLFNYLSFNSYSFQVLYLEYNYEQDQYRCLISVKLPVS